MREMKNNFGGKEITCFELSVYHNLIAISTNNDEFRGHILLWNYEFGKLSG